MVPVYLLPSLQNLSPPILKWKGWRAADVWGLTPTEILKWLIATTLYLPSESPRKDLHTKTSSYGEKIRTMLDTDGK